MELNKLLAFNQLVMDMPESKKELIANQFGIDYKEYKARIKGKEKEAEFLIILKSLDCVKHIEGFDEEISHLTHEFSSDLYVELSDGYKMMIEVKHTDEDYYKISSGNLKHRMEFAKRHGVPLRFAVSIKGFWGLFTSEDLQKKKGKLTISDFGGKKSISWLDDELSTCSYMMPENIKIKSIYMNDYRKGTGIFYPQYGELVSYELYSNDRKIFRFKGANSCFKIHSIYLEALQNRLSSAHQEILQSGNTTIITEYLDGNDSRCIIPEYEFLLAPIKKIVKDINGEKIGYDAIKAVADKDFQYLNVGILRMCMTELNELGMDIVVFKKDKGYNMNDYIKHFLKH